ncbi:hypothetical protein RclHR1_03860001 [Rhizophagus clarus]|uniref:Uncharacterized protein n=1 Tax=Rhizophagus clarus TaxID=94130 RepID=A0A2Z6RD15_9GLOM|nr:hypothetical protein RclHR1_03860001 [Rhizophagus clarus]
MKSIVAQIDLTVNLNIDIRVQIMFYNTLTILHIKKVLNSDCDSRRSLGIFTRVHDEVSILQELKFIA